MNWNFTFSLVSSSLNLPEPDILWFYQPSVHQTFFIFSLLPLASLGSVAYNHFIYWISFVLPPDPLFSRLYPSYYSRRLIYKMRAPLPLVFDWIRIIRSSKENQKDGGNKVKLCLYFWFPLWLTEQLPPLPDGLSFFQRNLHMSFSFW